MPSPGLEQDVREKLQLIARASENLREQHDLMIEQMQLETRLLVVNRTSRHLRKEYKKLRTTR